MVKGLLSTVNYNYDIANRISELDALGDIVLCMSQLQLSARAYHRRRRMKYLVSLPYIL
jgi:hypothetical protein